MYRNPPRPRAHASLSVDDLQQEHASLDERLKALSKLRSLSPEEQYEKMVIKKRKLSIKDQLACHAAP